MESIEDIKKYVAIAESLSVEAKNNFESTEADKDSALQQMGALLASNCQKLCIGPSFHFYTSEKSADCFKEESIQSEVVPRSDADNDDDDDEFETVLYHGPDAPYEILGEKNQHKKESILPELKLKLMNARLAKTSAEHGGLLTPHFFQESPDVASVESRSENERASGTDSEKRNLKCPFAYPAVKPNQDAGELLVDSSDHQLERVEILDGDPDDGNGMKLVEWSKKYIENKGFCLGVQPGNFFKDASKPYFYVKLPHRSNYEVVVTNNNQVPCDLDLHVNGQHVAALRLPAGTTRSIDGPQYSDHAFKLFRAKDAPPDRKVTEGAQGNGTVKAVFTPCKMENSRLRSASEPLRIGTRKTNFLDDLFDDPKVEKKERSFTVGATVEDKSERSVDISRVAEGVTLLQGMQKRKNYVLAPEMETDISKRVTLRLRLIASLDEEMNPTEEEICDLDPPPLPIK